MESPKSLKRVIDLFADNELELIIVTMRDQAPDILRDASQVVSMEIFRYFEDMAGINAALGRSGDVDSRCGVKRADIVEKLELLWDTLLGHIALSALMALWYRESNNIKDFIAELRSGDAAIVNCYLDFLAVPPMLHLDGEVVSQRQLDAIEYIKKEFPDVLLERAAS